MRSIRLAVQATADGYPGKTAGLAKEIGRTLGTFRNQCSPDQQDHWINLRDLVKILETTGDLEILHTLARRFNHVCIPVPDGSGGSDMEVLKAWSEWKTEQAETVTAIDQVLEKGHATTRQLDLIEREMHQDFEKEIRLMNRLKSLFAS